MRRSIPALALLACLAFAAQADETVGSSSGSPPAAKSFVAPLRAAGNPELRLPSLAEEERRDALTGGECTNVLCYKAAERRIVYRDARKYMPTFGGLTPEHISLHRDRIVFKYSFK